MDALTALLLAARDGDRSALRAFVERSQGEVWRFVAHEVGTAEADDVTQDAHVRAGRALPAFRHQASARTWHLSIARRACVDARRRRGRRSRLGARLADGARADAPDPAEVHALDALLSRLEPGRREAFVPTQLLGCSYAEAAAVCGVPVGTIRSRVARARADLIEALADDAAS